MAWPEGTGASRGGRIRSGGPSSRSAATCSGRRRCGMCSRRCGRSTSPPTRSRWKRDSATRPRPPQRRSRSVTCESQCAASVGLHDSAEHRGQGAAGGGGEDAVARTVGIEAAARLYAAFLRDLGARFAAAPFPVAWYVTPDDGWAEIAPLVGGAGPAVVQPPGDWGERQRHLLRSHEGPRVLIASDSPHLWHRGGGGGVPGARGPRPRAGPDLRRRLRPHRSARRPRRPGRHRDVPLRRRRPDTRAGARAEPAHRDVAGHVRRRLGATLRYATWRPRRIE